MFLRPRADETFGATVVRAPGGSRCCAFHPSWRRTACVPASFRSLFSSMAPSRPRSY